MANWTPEILGSVTPGTATYSVQDGQYWIYIYNILVRGHLVWSNHTGTGSLHINLPFGIETNANAIGHLACQNMEVPPVSVGSFIVFDPVTQKGVPMSERNNAPAANFSLPASGEMWFSGWYTKTPD